MTLEAKSSREWRNRMGIILLLVAGSSAWFFYDGLVAYPAYNRGAHAYAEIVQTVASEGLTDSAAKTETAARWEKRAAEFDADPKEPPKHEKNIAQQIHFGIGLAAIALIFVAWIFREMRRVIRANDEIFDGIVSVFPLFYKKTPVCFASVFAVDKRKWNNKGIAVVHYKDDAGRSRRAIIDDYKYAGSEEILKKCEEIVAAKISEKEKSGAANVAK